VDLTGVYDRLAAHGYRYGASFRCVTAVWRHGDDLYTDVQLPETVPAGGFGLHPALLDAAVHAGLLAGGGAGPIRVPFAWTGVDLHATGATRLRVRLSPTDRDAVSVTITDPAGRPVATVASLVTRPLPADPAAPAVRRGLLRPDWKAVETPPPRGTWTILAGDPAAPVDRLPVASDPASPSVGGTDVPGTEVLAVPAVGDAADIPGAVRELTATVLRALQRWQEEREPGGGRLVVVTTNATAPEPDLPAAAVWGLVRSALSEHPGRITLVDLDGTAASARALAPAVATGEPQLSIRDGQARALRLVPATPRDGRLDRSGEAVFGSVGNGVVLVTGGTGALGEVLLRHLVGERGVRRLVVVSRRGMAAPGVERLRDELAGLGAELRIVAGDCGDHEALAGVVAACGPELRAVVHLAGVTDDGVIASMTPERLAGVLAPKADAAWWLHELTEGLELSAFVLYSSASGLLGQPGQGNYAAANAFLDALATYRVARGLPAVSLAWGLWEQDGAGLGARLPAAARRRMGRTGIVAMTAAQGMALLDAALRDGAPVLAPILLDPAAPRADDPGLSPLLADLVAADRPAAGGAPPGEAPGAWRRRWAELPPQERRPALDALLRAELAGVLGYPDPAALPAEEPFVELGADSLTVTQLRNRLTALTGLRLPPTLLFDHPTLADLAAHLNTALAG
jgi:acyl carrier protein